MTGTAAPPVPRRPRAAFGLLRLLLRQVALLAAVAVSVFLLVRAAPLDPVASWLGPGAARLTPEQRAALEAAWGLDRSTAEQALIWLRRLLSGDPGFSISQNAPVAEVIGSRLSASLLLTGGAWLLSGLLGFALGCLAAMQRGRAVDHIIRFYCYLLASSPTFWLGLLLLSLFSVRLGWTPVCCAAPPGLLPEEVTPWQRLTHLILPLTALTLFGVAQIALHSRVKLIGVLQSDFVRQARAGGAGGLSVLWHHGLRHAGGPALVMMMASVGEIFGGAILAEQVFAWPGLGRASVEAGLQGDLPLLLAIALLLALVVSLANLAADRLARRLDPAEGAR